MMFTIKSSEFLVSEKFFAHKVEHRHIGAIAALCLISLLSSLSSSPDTHTISNCWEGFLWGLAAPVISLDCLAGVVAIGLLSGFVVRGAVINVSFTLAALLGIVINLFQINLLGVEVAIAVSTIAFGIMLVIPKQLNFLILALLGVSAGLCRGYVETESIISSEMIPLFAYMLGVTLTHSVVAMSARQISNLSSVFPNKIRLTGFAISAIGIVLLRNSIM